MNQNHTHNQNDNDIYKSIDNDELKRPDYEASLYSNSRNRKLNFNKQSFSPNSNPDNKEVIDHSQNMYYDMKNGENENEKFNNES